MKRYVLGFIAGGAIVLVGVPALLVGGYFLLEPGDRGPYDLTFVHLSEREAVVVTGSGNVQRMRRVRVDEGELVDVWFTDILVDDRSSDWTVVGDYLIGATASVASDDYAELVAVRLSDGHQVGRTPVKVLEDGGRRWDWLPLDDGTILVRNSRQLALAAVGDGGFIDRWRFEVPHYFEIGVTPEHVILRGDHVYAFRRADARDVAVPDELSYAQIAVSARSEEILVFSDRGLRVHPIGGGAPREITVREQDFPRPADGTEFRGRFCVHGERSGAWIVSYPASATTREVTLSNRTGDTTITGIFDVTVLAHEIAAVDMASGAVRWRMEAGEWMLACDESFERMFVLTNDRPLAAHHVFMAYQHGIAVPEEEGGPGDAVRFLSVDLDAGRADWFLRPPETPLHLAVRGSATYLYGATSAVGGTRIARFEDGKLTGAVVTRQILIEATALGADDAWLGEPYSPSWFHLHGPTLTIAQSHFVDPVATGMIAEESAASLPPLLDDAFEETAELFDLPPEAIAAR